MAGLCRAPGCGKPATRYGHYCTTHKSRWRRHGDVAQQGVTKEALRPYVALVRARIAKNAGNPTWAACDARWLAIVDHARGILVERVLIPLAFFAPFHEERARCAKAIPSR